MSNQKPAVGVIGASGYAGGEVVRLIDAHPGMSLKVIAGHTSAGMSLDEVHPQLTGGYRVLVSQDDALLADVDLMFLALPHGTSAGPAMALLERGVKVVDLGSDFRLSDLGRYEAAYGAGHPHPDQLGRWPYGLPEMNRADIARSDRAAVPGCYPIGPILAMAPLVAAGLIDPAGIVVDSMSGVSGAGRSAKADLTYGAVDEGVRAYAVTTHRHRPEMEQAIAAWTRLPIEEIKLSFTPHLVPMQRGILSTCSAPLTGSAEEVAVALQKAFADEPFVDVVAGPPTSRWVVGSNRCMMSPHVDEHTGRVIVIAAIDNLLKGAAGQAVQCANLMLGLPETSGLPTAGWMP
jgi:N-acetyl-gamma-glutamyl-phosphate reductase